MSGSKKPLDDERIKELLESLSEALDERFGDRKFDLLEYAYMEGWSIGIAHLREQFGQPHETVREMICGFCDGMLGCNKYSEDLKGNG